MFARAIVASICQFKRWARYVWDREERTFLVVNRCTGKVRVAVLDMSFRRPSILRPKAQYITLAPGERRATRAYSVTKVQAMRYATKAIPASIASASTQSPECAEISEGKNTMVRVEWTKLRGAASKRRDDE